MSYGDDRIRLRDLARGVVGALPAIVAGHWSLVPLATLEPQSRDSIGLLIERLARRHPYRPALRFEERTWSYAAFNGWANRVAHALRSRGVVAGDCVAILMENRPEVLACVAGVVKLGAIAGMINTHQRGEVLAHSIGLTRARVIIVGDECLEALESTPFTPKGGEGAGRRFLWDGAGGAPFGYANLRTELVGAPSNNLAETRNVAAGSPAFYIFTSGTTGLPKASVMSHLRWLKGAPILSRLVMRLTGRDTVYCALPLYHNSGLSVAWGAALGSGATLALGRRFSATRFWDEIRRYDATAFVYIGEVLRYLLNRPAQPGDRNHRVRAITGNGLRPEIWDAFQQRFGIRHIAEFYGASESNIGFVNVFGLSRTAGFCPFPYAIVECDAQAGEPRRGPDGFLRKVGRGGMGLLISEISNRMPFDGYTEEGATRSKVLHDVFARGDRWFNSGDLVRDQGFRHIAFVDRVGDTFRWKGENVATTQVEGVLNRHPRVEQAVAYGVQVPGADGRAGMAALTWRGGEFDGEDLARFLRADLPAYAVPLFIRLRAEQALTGTFKLRRVEIRDEGFDPGKVSEPLFALCDAARGYEPLSPELYARIASGELRF